MARAIWNGIVIAKSDDTSVVEGNHYFPPEAVRWEHLEESPTRTLCIWKGKASYYTVKAGGLEAPDAAWTYRKPWPLARRIKDHVAFWRGVEVVAD